MQPNPSPWLAWARELYSMAQAGLTYCQNDFDLDRYRRLQEISAEIIASQSALEKAAVLESFSMQKPDVLMTCDPQTLFTPFGLNHPDHRAAGQVTLDAVFPASGNELFFPELQAEGWQPHMPKEVWCSLTMQPNVTLDVTDLWDTKIRALKEHKSQIGDPAKLEERIRSRRTEDSTPENPRYEEKFRVVKWR